MTILHQLKQITQPYHTHVEQTVDLETRCQSLDGYRELLARFYGFYVPIETALAQVDDLSAMLSDLEKRYKARLIAHDLETLGVSATGREALPRCSMVPDLHTVAQALGCLYVLEGATLGGQIIARQVHQRLGMTASTGIAFFSSYGAQTGTMWRTFGTLLVAYATTSERTTAIIAAACATFQAFEQWLSVNMGK